MNKLTALLLGLMLVFSFGTAQAQAIPVTLSDSGIECQAEGVIVSGGSITFEAPGEYEITGTLSDGQIIVNCDLEGEVKLILNNVSIHNETGAAIHVKQCSSHIYVVLAEGSVNSLSGGTEYILDADKEPNGVLFSKDDITVEGSGALTITAPYMDGIVSKDDLRIRGGSITITADRNGIRGKDSVEILSGSIDITAGNDGIKSTNEKEAAKGYVEITGGDIRIRSADEPLSVVTRLTIRDCTIDCDVFADD